MSGRGLAVKSGLLAFVVAAGVGVGMRVGLAPSARLAFFDALQVRVGQPLGDQLRLLMITPKTFQASPAPACCPVQPDGERGCLEPSDLRYCHGELVDRLATAGAAGVGFDLDFTKPHAGDKAMAAGLKRALEPYAQPLASERRRPLALVLGSRWVAHVSRASLAGETHCCESEAGGERSWMCLREATDLLLASSILDGPVPMLAQAGYSNVITDGPAATRYFVVPWFPVNEAQPCVFRGPDDGLVVTPRQRSFSLALAAALAPDVGDWLADIDRVAIREGVWAATGGRDTPGWDYADLWHPERGSEITSDVKGKVVIVGSDVGGETLGLDYWPGARGLMEPGVQKQARAVATLAEGPGSWVSAASIGLDLAWIALVAVLLGLVVCFGRRRAVAGLIAVGLAVTFIIAALLVGGGLELALPDALVGAVAGAVAAGVSGGGSASPSQAPAQQDE